MGVDCVEMKDLVCLLLLFGVVAADDARLLRVSTEHGVVQGTSLDASEGKTVSAFLGIPYARPPIGDLRQVETAD